MTRTEWDAMFTKEDGTWDTEKYIAYQAQHDMERINKVNAELDKYKMAYEVSDTDGNTFVYAYIENDIPLYRTKRGGLTHLSDMIGLTVIRQYAE